MKTEKKKTCFDCLHCKVSVKSTEKNKLYYCAETMKKDKHREPYWLSKSVCQNFTDMD
jgi:hypothetical protein